MFQRRLKQIRVQTLSENATNFCSNPIFSEEIAGNCEMAEHIINL